MSELYKSREIKLSTSKQAFVDSFPSALEREGELPEREGELPELPALNTLPDASLTVCVSVCLSLRSFLSVCD